MSGPVPDERLYSTFGEMKWTMQDVEELRNVADRTEKWLQTDDVTAEQVANLLRAKADKIEACLRTIDNATGEDYNKLIKAVQYWEAGDYSSESVEQAWEEYGEKDDG